MSSIRVSNIEVKANPSSPTVDEKLKVTDSQGRVLMQVDGKTSGITTVGINTTGNTFTVNSDNGVNFTGIVTASVVSTGSTVSIGSTSITVGHTVSIGNTNIIVGDKFISSSGVGLGTTTTTGRNAGVGTEIGTLIYNVTTEKVEVYTGPAIGWIGGNLSVTFIASGGTEITSGTTKYHVFSSSGSFTVTQGSKDISYTVVGGGGGGGAGGLS